MSLKIGPDDQHQDILAKQSERHTGRKPEGKKQTNTPASVQLLCFLWEYLCVN